MRPHAEFLATFDAALSGGPLPEGLTAPAADEVARRFAVYRNNVTVSLIEALGSRFPVIRRLVGDEFFTAMARLFSVAERPATPVLHEWGKGFAAFLASFPPLADYPYMADVARIEEARGRAFHAADARPVDPSALTAADPDRLRLRLHPSVIVLPLAHPAVSIWAQNQPGGADASAAPGAGTGAGTGPETALILRDAMFTVRVRAVGPGDAALVAALIAGATLSEAAHRAEEAEPDHNPQHLLVHLMHAGAIVRSES